MRLIATFVLLGMLLGWIFDAAGSQLPSSATAQESIPVDVFIRHDRPSGQVRVFFANAATGLSAVATVEGFPTEEEVLDNVALTANGVVFRSPRNGLPHLLTPTGRVLEIDFIPQNMQNLLAVEWVISPDGRTIAWAEIFFVDSAWQADLYIAQLDGSDLHALPPLPETNSGDFSRVAMLAVSNNGERVFFDLEHPTSARSPDDLFVEYQHVTAYRRRNQAYLRLEEEPLCLCPAHVARNGQTFIRLEPATGISGDTINIWNLENNALREIPPIDHIYVQAGDILLSEDGSLMLYTLGGVEGVSVREEPAYALMLVNIVDQQQRIIATTFEQRFRPMAFSDDNRTAIIVNSREGEGMTYKLDLATGNYEAVAEGMWLGTLPG
jgi:hypothetical protein